ncbi:MAG: hypothetical protein L6R39_005329 [Caloplaca ligustica]|nr:MAG: hypothetical protein L6R39_005329 [Caloplaca ligustica]
MSSSDRVGIATISWEEGRLCHHFRLIFTDGACRSNGRDGATAGIGVAATEDDSGQWSIPVTGDLDMGQKRTSQRAELLAAQAGLRYLIISSPDEGRRKKGRKSGSTAESRNWIIATDSEYVVKGVTEWLPAWKQNNLRTNRNTVPANLDLFLYLDEELTAAEMKLNVKIGFWHVRREYNRIADGLAKKAALEGDPE